MISRCQTNSLAKYPRPYHNVNRGDEGSTLQLMSEKQSREFPEPIPNGLGFGLGLASFPLFPRLLRAGFGGFLLSGTV